MTIVEGGLEDSRVQALLAHHFTTARAQTAPGSAHALDLAALTQPAIRFWSGWNGDEVIAIGALKRLSDTHGEIKSMHTASSDRRTGAGSAMLRHIVAAHDRWAWRGSASRRAHGRTSTPRGPFIGGTGSWSVRPSVSTWPTRTASS